MAEANSCPLAPKTKETGCHECSYYFEVASSVELCHPTPKAATIRPAPSAIEKKRNKNVFALVILSPAEANSLCSKNSSSIVCGVIEVLLCSQIVHRQLCFLT